MNISGLETSQLSFKKAVAAMRCIYMLEAYVRVPLGFWYIILLMFYILKLMNERMKLICFCCKCTLQHIYHNMVI